MASTDRAERITTRDGPELLVRPIAADDRAAYLRAFEHLGEETRYKRFLAPIKHLTSSGVTYFTSVDHRNHEALIALTPDGEIVGLARYVRLGPTAAVAEVALIVADAWQGRGVGTALLHRLAARGRAAGIEVFRGICLSGNTDMQRLLMELGPGARVSHPDPGLVEIDARLPAEDAQRQPISPALRAAAHGHQHAKSGNATRGTTPATQG